MYSGRPRVGIIALLQESNTFLARQTYLQDFERDTLVTGEAVRQKFAAAPHEVGGFFAGLADADCEAVPIFAARTMPFGLMAAETQAALMARMDEAIERAGHLDGLLLAPHGANSSDSELDFDGYWVSRLRQRFGAGMPLIGTLDLHANVSRRLATSANAWVAYRTNPHLDQRACGLLAASIVVRTLRGELRPTMAAELLPLVVNIERQATDEEPCRQLYAAADEVRQQPGVLAVSLLLGFPYGDVPQLGVAVIVVTDDNQALARSAAAELARRWWQDRDSFSGRLIDPPAALKMASAAAGPVGLLDMGDNVGGGSPGDGTVLAAALMRERLGPSFACLYDPEAVAACRAVGAGGSLSLSVGAKSDRLHGDPIKIEATVMGLYDGRFTESEARHGGLVDFDQGATAVVSDGAGMTLMLTSQRMAPFSIRQLTTFGIEPAAFRYIAIKGVHAPVAAYAPHCKTLIRVNTPGVTTADLSRLNFHRRRQPMFPFEPETVWQSEGQA